MPLYPSTQDFSLTSDYLTLPFLTSSVRYIKVLLLPEPTVFLNSLASSSNICHQDCLFTMSLLDLPPELFQRVIKYYVHSYGLRGSLVTRLVGGELLRFCIFSRSL